jgi:hypothetical protein
MRVEEADLDGAQHVGRRRLALRRVEGEHRPEGHPEIGAHDDDRAPEEVLLDRLLVDDLDAHVQRHLDPEQRQDHEAEDGPRRALEGLVGGELAHARRRRVARAEQPQDPGEADDERRAAVGHDGPVDVVLRHAQPQCRHPGREPQDSEDDEALLPRLGQAAVEDELQQRDDRVARRHHHEHARPPRAEAGEEAPERAERLLRPDVERALLREHEPELRRDQGARDQEQQEAQDPVRERGRPGRLHGRRLHDEEHDRDEDHDHVERPEDPRQHSGRDALGRHHAVAGGGGRHACTSPRGTDGLSCG